MSDKMRKMMNLMENAGDNPWTHSPGLDDDAVQLKFGKWEVSIWQEGELWAYEVLDRSGISKFNNFDISMDQMAEELYDKIELPIYEYPYDQFSEMF